MGESCKTCPTCEGTGSDPNAQCYDEGVIVCESCPTCFGDGEVCEEITMPERSSSRNVRPESPRLPVTDGRPDNECGECHGTGMIDVDCDACHGDACDDEGNPCRVCDGYGTMPEDCPECGGEGTLGVAGES